MKSRRAAVISTLITLSVLLVACAPRAGELKSESSSVPTDKSVATEVYSTASDVQQCALFEKALSPFYESKSASVRRSMWPSMAWKMEPLAFMAVDEDLQDAFYAAMDVAETQTYDNMTSSPQVWANAIAEVMAVCDLGLGYSFDRLNAAFAQ